MYVYEFRPDSNNHDTLVTSEYDDQDYVNETLKCRPMTSIWKPIRVEFDTRKASSDFPCLTLDTPVFSVRAWKALESLLAGHAEALPLVCDDAELYLINLFDELDCVDYDKSDYRWDMWTNGPAPRVFHYVLRPEVVAGYDMFRIKEAFAAPVCISQRFVDEVKKAGLVGLRFRRLR